MPFVLAQDIGYSNLKLAFGEADADAPEVLCRPSQAVPMSHMPPGYAAGANRAAGEFQVLVGEERWVACIDPGRVPDGSRALHEDFSERESYRALFHASLAATGRDTVDLLVTGLPVHQFHDESRRDMVKSMLLGTHQIAQKRLVEVKEVHVVPQPMGAFWDVYSKVDDPELLDNGYVVVLDPGFFSADYAVFQRGEIVLESSNASLKSMSVFLDHVNAAIADDHGEGPGTDKIEIALQRGKTEVFLHGKRLLLTPYFERVAMAATKPALEDLLKGIRFRKGAAIDAVILAGGGAHVFEAPTRELFPKAEIIKTDEPVTSNAKGFWVMGASAFAGE